MIHAYPVGSHDHKHPLRLDGLAAHDHDRNQGSCDADSEAPPKRTGSASRDRERRAAAPFVTDSQISGRFVTIRNDCGIRCRREGTLGDHDVVSLGCCSSGGGSPGVPVGSGFRRRSIRVAGRMADARVVL